MTIMKTFQLLAGFGLILLILTTPIPWLTLNFFSSSSNESFNLILADMYILMLKVSKLVPETDTGLFYKAITQMLPTMITLIAATFLYSLSIVLGTLSIAFRRVSIWAGLSSFLTGFLWIIGVETLKANLIEEAVKPDGIFESLFTKGISSVITVGYGAYVVVLVGVIFFIAFFLDRYGSEDKVLKSSLREIKDGLKATQDKCNRLSAGIQMIQETNLKLAKDYNELRKEHDGIISILLKCRVENAYTLGDRLFADIRNIGSLPINWVEVMDIEPRPKGANLPSEQIQLLGGINPGQAVKFTYDLKDIYGKPIVFDPVTTYTIKFTVGWNQVTQTYDTTFKVTGSGSQFRAEIDGEYTTGNNLILNVKNVGVSKITSEKITSITPSPGGVPPPVQTVVINPGETKTLWFTWVNGEFVSGISYTVGLELSDGTNSYSLSFVVVAS